LRGATIMLSKLDGTNSASILQRRSLELAAGQYAVLGRSAASKEPEHVDHGYASEFGGRLYESGVLELLACGSSVDRVVYRDCPQRGTLMLDGAIAPPNAGENDRESSWCVNGREYFDRAGRNLLGTPGERNPACKDIGTIK
jgi:hypothetical protein